MKQILKCAVEVLPGQWSLSILDVLRRMRYPKLRHRHQLEQAVLEKIGRPTHVLSGPFKDMRYVSGAYFGSVVPKILGIYELELAEAIDKVCQLHPDVIVDIGAAEGYYAVGMTMRNPQARTICFEMYKPAHSLLRRLAKLNGASDRVEIRGICDLASLRDSLEKTKIPAVICDCEGAEDFLMDPQAVPGLKSAVMIIEIHEDYAVGVSARIRERFKESHTLTVVNSHPRTLEELPSKVKFSDEEFEAAVDEGRPKAEWYFLVPIVKHP